MRLEERLRELCAERDWRIEALTIQPDHVHLFVSCPPRDAPATVMNVIKSITADLIKRYIQEQDDERESSEPSD